MRLATKILISMFLAVHLGSYVIRISPFEITAKLMRFSIAGHETSLYELARTYQSYTLTGVSGQLFAPLPARANTYIGATVELTGGATRDFRFPLPRDAGWLGGKRFEPFHKLGSSLQDKSSAPYYPDVCRYIARTIAASGEQPQRVRLLVFHAPIPLDSRPQVHLAEQQPWFDYTRMLRDEAQYTGKLLLDYTVQPEDLA